MSGHAVRSLKICAARIRRTTWKFRGAVFRRTSRGSGIHARSGPLQDRINNELGVWKPIIQKGDWMADLLYGSNVTLERNSHWYEFNPELADKLENQAVQDLLGLMKGGCAWTFWNRTITVFLQHKNPSKHFQYLWETIGHISQIWSGGLWYIFGREIRYEDYDIHYVSVSMDKRRETFCVNKDLFLSLWA